MIDDLITLPSDRRRALTSALETGWLKPPFTAVRLAAHVGDEHAQMAAEALGELDRRGIAGAAAAACIRAVERSVARTTRPDLVWSGPETPGLHARRTEQVYAELIAGAKRDIWISTFAFFDGPQAFASLAARMDAEANLTATLLLNIQRESRNTNAADVLVGRFGDRFWGKDWPGARRPRVFYDPRSLNSNGDEKAVLHAKAIVVDDESLLVTSANLTEAALTRNIELGLLVRDRTMATTVKRQFELLIEQKKLVRLPER